MTTSLDIVGKIDRDTVELFRTVCQAIESLGIAYVVVGATARDLVLHHAHGAGLERATKDVDFAVAIPDWGAFHALRGRLEQSGFTSGREPHRSISPKGAMVDIVPFGRVEDETSSIAWPPEGGVVMSVLGFQEACDQAERVCIAGEPDLTIPVATPTGLALLKLIAWNDWARERRSRDARDFAYLLENYERIPEITERLFGEEWTPVMEHYDWDLTQAAAYMLGHDAAHIARRPTRTEIAQILSKEKTREHLVTDMCNRTYAEEFDKNDRLLTAFLAGFESEHKSIID